MDFLDYVNKIKSIKSETLFDYKGREIWVIKTEFGEIYYRQYFCDSFPIDGCCFQLRGYSILQTSMFDESNPKDFYKNILAPLIEHPNIKMITPKELKTMGAKKLFDKDGERFYKDNNNNYYSILKQDLPTKKNNEAYTKYQGTNAVYVKYGTSDMCNSATEYEWFESFEDFQKFFEEFKKTVPPTYGGANYKIIKTADKLHDLNECHTVYSLGNPPPDYGSLKNQATMWPKRAAKYNKLFNPYYLHIDYFENLLEYIREETKK